MGSCNERRRQRQTTKRFMKSEGKTPPHTTPSILAGHAKTPRPIILVRAWRNTLFRQKAPKISGGPPPRPTPGGTRRAGGLPPRRR